MMNLQSTYDQFDFITNLMESDHVSEDLSGWEHVQSPFSAITAKLMISNDGDGDGDSVAVKDNFYGESSSNFPPGNHEDLPINDGNDGRCLDESEPLDRQPLPSVCEDDGSRKSEALPFGGGMIRRIADRFRESVRCTKAGPLSSVAWTAGGVAAVLLALYLHRRAVMWRQRQMQLESRNKKLVLVVREKDKKINELLVQIARMNEVLLARRRIPVIRVK